MFAPAHDLRPDVQQPVLPWEYEEVVSLRASFMASAGIAALLKKMDYKDVVIAIDGSLFRYHPHFKNVMLSCISQVHYKI